MSDLENIASALLIGLAAASVPGLIMAHGMQAYANNYNYKSKRKFLKKNFGKRNLDKIVEGQPYADNRKRIILVPIKFSSDKYVLELEHQKTHWLADLFYDTRLYDPVKIYKV